MKKVVSSIFDYVPKLLKHLPWIFQGFCYAWGSAPNPVLRQEGEGTAIAVPETLGLSVSLRQGLPGCFASSVLSLDSVPAPSTYKLQDYQKDDVVEIIQIS